MKYAYIIYNSITFASRVKREAARNFCWCSVLQTPGEISTNGCSYSIRCKAEDVSRVVAASAKLNIQIKGIYLGRQEQGRVKYEPYDLS